jgi:hypothetical protein
MADQEAIAMLENLQTQKYIRLAGKTGKLTVGLQLGVPRLAGKIGVAAMGMGTGNHICTRPKPILIDAGHRFSELGSCQHHSVTTTWTAQQMDSMQGK